jgi:ribosomal protein S4E
VKKFDLQLLSHDGDVIENSTLELNESDTLIIQFPEDETYEHIMTTANAINESLENNRMIVIPKSWTMRVLRKN